MNGLFGGLFDFNLSNLIGGMDMGVNFDNMTMDQKRQALRGMTKGTMLGGVNPELPMPIQLPDAAAQAATGAMDPMMMSAILGGGLLNPQQQQMLPIVQQQAIPGLSIPMANMNRFYGGLL